MMKKNREIELTMFIQAPPPPPPPRQKRFSENRCTEGQVSALQGLCGCLPAFRPRKKNPLGNSFVLFLSSLHTEMRSEGPRDRNNGSRTPGKSAAAPETAGPINTRSRGGVDTPALCLDSEPSKPCSREASLCLMKPNDPLKITLLLTVFLERRAVERNILMPSSEKDVGLSQRCSGKLEHTAARDSGPAMPSAHVPEASRWHAIPV